MAGRLLGSHGFGLYSINVFVVWVECVKAFLVNVCKGTAKSAEFGSRDMRVSTGQHADCAVEGGEFPFIYLFGCVGGVFSGGLFSTQPSQR